MTQLEDRLAHQALAFQDDPDAVVRWLESLGCRLVHHEGGQWTLDGLTHMRCGLVTGMDPMTTAVQFGFLLSGPFWPHLYPQLLKAVNRLWREKHDACTAH